MGIRREAPGAIVLEELLVDVAVRLNMLPLCCIKDCNNFIGFSSCGLCAELDTASWICQRGLALPSRHQYSTHGDESPRAESTEFSAVSRGVRAGVDLSKAV